MPAIELKVVADTDGVSSQFASLQKVFTATSSAAEDLGDRIDEALNNIDASGVSVEISQVSEAFEDAADAVEAAGDTISSAMSSAGSDLSAMASGSDAVAESSKSLSENAGDAEKSVGGMAAEMRDFVEGAGEAHKSTLSYDDALKAVGSQLGVNAQLLDVVTTGTIATTAAITAGATAVVAATTAWAEYNAELSKQDQVVGVTTGLQGSELEAMTTQVRALSNAYGVDFREGVNAANTLMQQFGVSGQNALDTMAKGMKGMIMGDGPKMLSMIQQYAPAFRDAGLSAEEFTAIINNTEGGIFTDENMSAITFGIKNIRDMSTATEEALTNIGVDVEDMRTRIENGSTTVFEALQEVAGQIENVGSGSKAAGEVMTNVFGRQGISAGTNLGKAIATLNTNLDETSAQTGKVGEAYDNLRKANERFETAMRALFQTSGEGWEEMTTQLRADVINALIDVISYFVDLYNESMALRFAVNFLAASFKSVWIAVKAMAGAVVDIFKGLGGVVMQLVKAIDKAMHLDFDGAKKELEGLGQVGKKFWHDFKEEGMDAAEAFGATMEDVMRKTESGRIDLTRKLAGTTGTGTGTGNTSGSGGKGGTGKGTGKNGSNTTTPKNAVEKARAELQQAEEAFDATLEAIVEKSAQSEAEAYNKVIQNTIVQKRDAIDLENAKTIATIKANAKAQQDAALEAFKQRWIAQQKLENAQAKKNEEPIFDVSKLDAETKKAYDAVVAGIEESAANLSALQEELYAKQIKDFNEEIFGEMLQQFGGYAEQRLALERQYVKDLQKLQDARETAAMTGDEEMLARIDNTIAELTKKRDKELAALDFSKFQEQIGLSDMLGSVQGYNDEALDKMASSLRKVIEANEDLTPDGIQRMKTLEDALSKIYAIRSERNPVDALKTALDELDKARADQAAKQAQQDLAGGMAYGTSTLQEEYDKAVEAMDTKMIETLRNVKTSVQDASGEFLTFGQILDQNRKALTSVSTAQTRVATANKAAQKEWQKQSSLISKATRLTKAVGDELQELGAKDVGMVVSAIGELGDVVMQGIQDIKSVVDNSVAAMQGASKGAAQAISTVEKASIILTIISVAFQVISKVFNLAKEMHNAHLQDDIDVAETKIVDLQNAYEDLEDVVDKTYSKDKRKAIADQNKNLKRQNELIKEQMRLEEEKKEDDKDKQEALRGYQDQLRENNKLIEENKAAMQDAIFGDDIQSAIEEFADTYINAMNDGTSVKKAAKQMVIDMVKSMITESMKADIETPMRNLRNKMEEMYADNIISPEEQKTLEAESERIAQQLKDKYEWANNILKGDLESFSGSQGGFATASQESIDELNGRFAQSQMALEGSFNALLAGNSLMSAVQSSLGDLNNGVNGIQLLLVQSNGYLENIETLCKRIVNDALPRFERIEKTIEGI